MVFQRSTKYTDVKKKDFLTKKIGILCHTTNSDNTDSPKGVLKVSKPESENTYIMKKLFSFLAIIGIIFASNCSRIPENNDPIIGIWDRVEITNSETGKQTVRIEWIFNDAYLGRFHRVENGQIVVKSDFSWIQQDGIYTISYPGLERGDDHVSLKQSVDGSMLERNDGFMLATRD